MPAEETPRQKKQASYPRKSAPDASKSNRSLRTSSRNFGCVVPGELRPTASTASTPSSRKHSRRTPCPTIPVAPKRITFIQALRRSSWLDAHERQRAIPLSRQPGQRVDLVARRLVRLRPPFGSGRFFVYARTR